MKYLSDFLQVALLLFLLEVITTGECISLGSRLKSQSGSELPITNEATQQTPFISTMTSNTENQFILSTPGTIKALSETSSPRNKIIFAESTTPQVDLRELSTDKTIKDVNRGSESSLKQGLYGAEGKITNIVTPVPDNVINKSSAVETQNTTSLLTKWSQDMLRAQQKFLKDYQDLVQVSSQKEISTMPIPSSTTETNLANVTHSKESDDSEETTIKCDVTKKKGPHRFGIFRTIKRFIYSIWRKIKSFICTPKQYEEYQSYTDC